MAGGVQSIERAFAVMRALSVGPLGVTDIAERTDLPKSTVSRLLSALEAEGAVTQTSQRSEYGLGPTLADLAGAAAPGYNLVTTARPYLIELTDAIGETSGVSVLDGTEVYYLDHVHADEEVQVRSWTGEKTPLHAVSSGLVMLAFGNEPRLLPYLAGPLVRLTPQTVTSRGAIMKRCEQIRDDGSCWAFGELAEGLNSVAAPILDADGVAIAALHVHGPAYRFPTEGSEPRIADLVVEAGEKLSAQLLT